MTNLTIDKKINGDHTFISFKGKIDEHANLENVFFDLQSNATIILQDIDLINSSGVRKLVRAFQEIPSHLNVKFEKCSPWIVEQINYVANLLNPKQIVSFYAPYFCNQCKTEVNILFTVKDFLEKFQGLRPPSQTCPSCHGALDFDDIEEEYFSFLKRINN